MHIKRRVGVVVSLALAVSVPASAEPAGATDPVPKPAMSPAGGTAGAGAAGNASASSAERSGPFLDVNLGVGARAMLADLQLGWMINAHLGVFGSLGGAVADEAGVGLLGIGARVSQGPVFAEARVAWAIASNDCDFDEPCSTSAVRLAILGAGFEFIHLRHFGMELRGQLLTDGHDTVSDFGIGLGVYF